MQTVSELVKAIKQEFPKFEFVDKQDSRFMRFLNTLLLVVSFGRMKSFMRFTTTIGYTIYASDVWDSFSEEHKLEVLRHERVHMRQRRHYGWWFNLMYLFLPLPIGFAYFRAKFEQEAYEESMHTIVALSGLKTVQTEAFRTRMIERFTGSSYLWMWVRRSDIEDWFDTFLATLIIKHKSMRP